MNQDQIKWRHVFGYGGSEGGITIGIDQAAYDHELTVYLSRCNPKDSFCKRIGREQALKNEPYRVHIKDLPAFIANYTVRLYGLWKPELFFRKEVENWSKFALQFVD
jgi:hypothetical protein